MPWLSLWNISLVLSCRYSTNGADFWLLFGNQGLPNPSVWWVYRSVMVYWSNEWPETVKLGCWSGYHKKITIRHFFWDTLYTFLLELVRTCAFACFLGFVMSSFFELGPSPWWQEGLLWPGTRVEVVKLLDLGPPLKACQPLDLCSQNIYILQIDPKYPKPTWSKWNKSKKICWCQSKS